METDQYWLYDEMYFPRRLSHDLTAAMTDLVKRLKELGVTVQSNKDYELYDYCFIADDTAAFIAESAKRIDVIFNRLSNGMELVLYNCKDENTIHIQDKKVYDDLSNTNKFPHKVFVLNEENDTALVKPLLHQIVTNDVETMMLDNKMF